MRLTFADLHAAHVEFEAQSHRRIRKIEVDPDTWQGIMDIAMYPPSELTNPNGHLFGTPIHRLCVLAPGMMIYGY